MCFHLSHDDPMNIGITLKENSTIYIYRIIRKSAHIIYSTNFCLILSPHPSPVYSRPSWAIGSFWKLLNYPSVSSRLVIRNPVLLDSLKNALETPRRGYTSEEGRDFKIDTELP